MKIVIINGSPRANGSTGQILSSIKDSLTEIDPTVEIDYRDLGKMNMSFCSGCNACYKKGKCYIKEDGLEELSDAIDQCDGVVFGSPTYVGNVSGQFKIMIDRGHFVFEQLLKNKACFSVVTYKNYGAAKVNKVIKELIRFSGGAVSSQLLYKSSYSQAFDNKQSEQIKKLCRKFLDQAKRKNPLSPLEKITGGIIFHAGIKPHVLKNKAPYEGVINRWIKNGIIAG